jgi:hypothetical protein
MANSHESGMLLFMEDALKLSAGPQSDWSDCELRSPDARTAQSAATVHFFLAFAGTRSAYTLP